MKRLSIWGAALCAAAVFTLVCTSVEYNNPYDPDSPDFGKINGGDYSEQMREYLNNNPGGGGKDLVTYINNLCDKTSPKIKVLVKNPDTILYNTTAGRTKFDQLMLRSGSYITGIVEEIPGADIKAYLASTGDPNTPLPNQNLPTEESTYAIVYWATKPQCDGIVPENKEPIIVHFKFNIEADTSLPVITMNQVGGKIHLELYVGNEGRPFSDPGASAQDAKGSIPVTATHDVNIDKEGKYTVVYKACKILIYGDGRPEKEVCETETRNVDVIPKPVTSRPPAYIVLNMYKHNINGTTYNLRDTVFLSGDGNATDFKDPGVKEVFYINSDKQKVPIPSDRVTTTRSSFGYERSIKYALAQTDEYAAAEASRSGYVLDRTCDTDFSAPAITGGATDRSIPAGQFWTPPSWDAFCTDDSNWGKPLGIEFGTLDYTNPSGGPHQIKYVAVSGCRSQSGGMTTTVKTVTITVAQ